MRQHWQSVADILITVVAMITAVVYISVPANAKSICGETMSHHQFVEQMITTVPNLDVVTMSKEQQESYVAALNAILPKTDYHPHKVYIYRALQFATMLVEMVDIHGCMLSVDKIAPDRLFFMMGVTEQLQGV